MSTINHARERISAALDEIDQLMQSDFPSQHTKDAMDILQIQFRKMASVLDRTRGEFPSIAQNQCSVSIEQLFVYVPILGFILRSTNARNGFEAYSPLLHLTEYLLGSDAKLVVSSEWEYSPFVYLSMSYLPGFVLIGLPATESSNPLIIPLAGHELGHSVWASYSIGNEFITRIERGVLNEIRESSWEKYLSFFPQYKKADLEEDWIARLTWEPARQWALLQAEEMFCDFLGIRLFAESYLHAFHYLLSPGTLGQRSLRYPNIERRVRHLVDAASNLSVNTPVDFVASFISDAEPDDPKTAFFVSIADAVSASCASDLLNKAKELADSQTAPTRDLKKVSIIAEQFKKWVTPTISPETLVDISCAGWQCNLDKELWKHIHQFEPKDWGRVLRDLMFKSMEVSEIHERLEKARQLRESS